MPDPRIKPCPFCGGKAERPYELEIVEAMCLAWWNAMCDELIGETWPWECMEPKLKHAYRISMLAAIRVLKATGTKDELGTWHETMYRCGAVRFEFEPHSTNGNNQTDGK